MNFRSSKPIETAELTSYGEASAGEGFTMKWMVHPNDRNISYSGTRISFDGTCCSEEASVGKNWDVRFSSS